MNQLSSSPLGLYMLVVGGVIMLIGALYLVSRLRLLLADRAEGVVIGHEKRGRTEHGDPYYHPRVRFEEPLHGPVEFVSLTGRDRPSPPVGTPVRVAYRPEEPEKAEISGVWRLIIAPSAVLLFGLAVIAIPLIAG